MKPEAQRIAIAGACGTLKWSTALPQKVLHCDVPDYLDDLNAMHEAENTAFPMYLMEYCTNLAEVVYEYPEAARMNQLWQGWWFVHATAAQRAEAFLKTLNLWTDD